MNDLSKDYLTYFCPHFLNPILNSDTMKKHLLIGALVLCVTLAHAQGCSEVFISEYVEGTFNNKAIELYNPTPNAIDLGAGNYKFGRDRDGAGNPMLMEITGIIAPYDVRVFVLDKRDPNGTGNEVPVDDALMAAADTFVNPVYVQSNSPFYFNGDDAFVLVKGTSTILDIVGKIGEDPGNGWAVPGDPFTRWWTTDNTMIRKSTITTGVTSNPLVFDPSLEWDSLPANDFSQLGTHECVCGSVGISDPSPENRFTVFPNPLERGSLSIRSEKEMTGYALMAPGGQLVALREDLGSEFFHTLELPASEPGMYFLEIRFADGSRGYRKLLSR